MPVRVAISLIALSLLSVSGCASLPTVPAAARNEHVVLLHGIWRTSKSMNKLEAYLSSQGFDVININYPSRRYPIEALTRQVGDQIDRYRERVNGKVHFVTHSMGGVILRAYLKDNDIPDLGRVVMLAPPNQGCELVDQMGGTFHYRVIFGPAGQQLGTEPDSVPNALGPVDFELGVIAGNKTVNPILSSWLPGADDGRVTVERTKVEGMDDFLVVPRSHVFIMKGREVMEQVIHFLDHGRFDRSDTEGTLAGAPGAGS